MKLGCGKYDSDTFLLNVDNPSEEFSKHINSCEDCKTSFTEIKVATLKMDTADFEPLKGLKYGKILLRLKDNLLEIIDAISGTRYGAKLAYRGDEVFQTRKEVIYESKNMRIFVDSYDADELILSTRVNDYGEITILDSNNNIIRATRGKSGVDIRIKVGKYIVKHGDEEIVVEVVKEV